MNNMRLVGIINSCISKFKFTKYNKVPTPISTVSSKEYTFQGKLNSIHETTLYLPQH